MDFNYLSPFSVEKDRPYRVAFMFPKINSTLLGLVS